MRLMWDWHKIVLYDSPQGVITNYVVFYFRVGQSMLDIVRYTAGYQSLLLYHSCGAHDTAYAASKGK